MVKVIIRKLFTSMGYEVKKKGSADTFFELDPSFVDIYKKAQLKTQMESTDNALRRQRHYTLNYLLRNVDIAGGGDICDVGCWRGLSAYQIASYLDSKKENKVFHIFDSFEGLSELTLMDKYEGERRDINTLRKHFACTLEQVKSNLQEFNFINYYKGWIPDRFEEVKNKIFSFVHIDVDLYRPTKDSFDFFYPRLMDKGVMVFDDYGCIQFPGVRKAVNECLAGYDKIFFLPYTVRCSFFNKEFL